MSEKTSPQQDWKRTRPPQREPALDPEHDGPTQPDSLDLQMSPSLLGDPRTATRGNRTLRAASLQAAQRTQGNRAVQRTVHRPVQRDDSGDGIWGSIKGLWNNEVKSEQDASKEVKKAEDATNSGINWLENAESGLAHSLANDVSGVPVLGSVANAGANWVDWASQVQGGILKGATGLVGGAVNMAENPIGTVKGLEAMAEHSSPVGILNPFKTIHQGYNVLSGQESLGDAANELFNPMQQMKENADFSTAMANGLLQPYKESWNQGKYGEVAGRAAFDVGSLVIGAGEAKAGSEAGNLAKAAEVADAASGATKAADLADASKAADAAKAAGEVGPSTLRSPGVAPPPLEPVPAPTPIEPPGSLPPPEPGAPIEPGPATQPAPKIPEGPPTQPGGPATQPGGPATQPGGVPSGPATQPAPNLKPVDVAAPPSSGPATVPNPTPTPIPDSTPPSQLVPDVPPQEIPPPAPSQPPPTIPSPPSQAPSVPAPQSVPGEVPPEMPPSPNAPDVSVPPGESPKTSPAPSPEFLQNPTIPKPTEAPGWGERLLQEEADLGKKINETEWFWEQVEKLKKGV